MTNSKVDYEKLVAKVIAEGWKKDVSESVSLERAGLLLTDRVKVQLVSTALMGASETLDLLTAQQLIPIGVPLNFTDIKRYIAIWLRDTAEAQLRDFKER